MAQLTPTEVQNGIVAANETFMAAFSRGDAAALAASYTKDGQLLPPHSDTGKQAIEAFWQSAMDMGITQIKLESLHVEGEGHTAYDVGKVILLGAGGQTIDTGKYVVVWKQEESQWKVHCDIWNSNLPAPAQ
jgi:ketosteroid isomerase-like protein